MGEIINNDIYHSLGDRWYQAYDDPIALLRAESQLIVPWIHQTSQKLLGTNRSFITADLGCGGGLVSNKLAKLGHMVTGIDLSASSLEIARKYDSTKSVSYQIGDITSSTLPSASFDVVTACDVIEHIEQPDKLIEEAFRTLKPGGLFFFHTFNRNMLSELVVIHLLTWLIKNTPKNLHIKSLFVTPKEMKDWSEKTGFIHFTTTGIRPSLRSLIKPCLFKGHVPKGAAFKFTSNTWISYAGYAIKPGLTS